MVCAEKARYSLKVVAIFRKKKTHILHRRDELLENLGEDLLEKNLCNTNIDKLVSVKKIALLYRFILQWLGVALKIKLLFRSFLLLSAGASQCNIGFFFLSIYIYADSSYR